MFFENEITEKLEIRTKKQAKGIIEEYINEFEEIEKNDDVWGQLVLLFKEHQEIYNINDSWDVVVGEDDNPLSRLSEEIIAKDLIGSIYVHYDDEKHRKHIACSISSIFLNVAVIGEKFIDKDEVAFLDEDPNKGLRCDPLEITKMIDYYKGCQYFEELMSNFNIYIGINDSLYNSFPMEDSERTIYQRFTYRPDDVKRFFNIDVKNDYIFDVYEPGEIITSTILSSQHLSKDEEFVKYCLHKQEEIKNTDIYLKAEEGYSVGDYFIEGKHIMACNSNLTIINALKLIRAIPKKKENEEMLPKFVKATLANVIQCIEKYCNTICGSYKR